MSTKKGRILLIDDDPIFTTVMKRAAELEGIKLETYHSLEDLGSVGMLNSFDAAIIDWNLGSMNGLEIAEYIHAFKIETPVILISNSLKPTKEAFWPSCIKKFIHKSHGHSFVVSELQKALA